MVLFKISEEDLAEYIREISSGNEKALADFYDKYGGLILAQILSVVESRESAEEVLQDVLMSIVSHNQDIHIENARGWLIKVIRNLSKKKANKDLSQKEESLPENEKLPFYADISETVENSIDQIEAFECLDEVERQCVIMCVYGQMKLPQVAEILEMPYTNVCNKFYYAVRKLRKYYDERGNKRD